MSCAVFSDFSINIEDSEYQDSGGVTGDMTPAMGQLSLDDTDEVGLHEL